MADSAVSDKRGRVLIVPMLLSRARERKQDRDPTRGLGFERNASKPAHSSNMEIVDGAITMFRAEWNRGETAFVHHS
jgi:hypothetical protein